MVAVEHVWRWLRAAAGEHLDWRHYMTSGTNGTAGRPVLLVLWDAAESPCSKCHQVNRRPCPVDLDGEKPRVRISRHDCGTESAPARHVTRWLSEITSQDDVQALVRELGPWGPTSTAGAKSC